MRLASFGDGASADFSQNITIRLYKMKAIMAARMARNRYPTSFSRTACSCLFCWTRNAAKSGEFQWAKPRQKENAPPTVIDGANFRKRRLGGELQFLARPERDFLARLDLDRLAGCGITPHARGALSYLQDAKTSNPDAFSLLQMPGDQADEIVEKNVSRPFR
jgi:hypothetical protein